LHKTSALSDESAGMVACTSIRCSPSVTSMKQTGHALWISKLWPLSLENSMPLIIFLNAEHTNDRCIAATNSPLLSRIDESDL